MAMMKIDEELSISNDLMVVIRKGKVEITDHPSGCTTFSWGSLPDELDVLNVECQVIL